MAWVYLIVAGLFEVGWATSMKYADGLAKPGPAAIAIAASIVSFVLLAMAMKTLPLGTAYSVWTGIGAVGTTILGIVLFQESGNPLRLACIGLIIIGIVGLKLTMPESASP